MMDKRLFSYVSILINSLPVIIILIWASLLTYVKSYYYYSYNISATEIQFVVVIFAIATNISFYGLQVVVQYYNNKKSLLILNGLTALGYFFIPHCSNLLSLYMLFLLLTVSQRTTLNVLNHISVDLFMKNKSMIIGINLSASSLGAIIWNILLTYLINPNNVKVDHNGNLPVDVANNLSYYTNSLTLFTVTCGGLAYYLMDESLCFNKSMSDMGSSSSSIFKKSSSIKTATFGVQNKSGIELQESMLEDRDLPNFNYDKQANMSSFNIGENNNDTSNDKCKSVNLKSNTQPQAISFTIIPTLDEEKADKSYIDETVNKNSIYSFSNSKIASSLREATVIRSYVLTRAFMVIWASSFCRNVFNIYIKNNFKTISLFSINDDKFINEVSSATLSVMLIAQIFSGSVIDKIGPFIVTLFVYSSSFVIILCYLYDPASRILFIVAIVFNRVINGINLLLNNSLLYGLYSRVVVVKLMKYFFINSVVSSIVTVLVDMAFVVDNSYTRVWIFYLIVTMLGSLFLYVEMKRF